MNFLDEYLETLASERPRQQSLQQMTLRVLTEKLADLAQLLARSERLAARGFFVELSGGTLVIGANGSTAARWTADGDVLRLTWAGRDFTTDNVKHAARMTAGVLAEECPDVLPEPHPIEPASTTGERNGFSAKVSNAAQYNFLPA